MMKRIPSGVPGLDELIQGGFPVGTNLLLLGAPMTGKTTMAMQFIYKGLTLGEGGIFISTNETAEDVQKKMTLFSWDTSSFEEMGIMKYVDCYGMMIDNKLSDTLSIKRVPSILAFTSLSVVLSEMCSHFWKLQKQLRIVFDSISSLLLYTRPDAVLRFLHVLLGRFKRMDAVSILTLEEGMHGETVETTLKQLCEGAFRLTQIGNERAIRCLGLAATHCTTQEIMFEITDEGLIIKQKGQPKNLLDKKRI